MAGSRDLTSLLVRITADSAGLQSELRRTEQSFARTARSLRTAGNNLSLYVSAPLAAIGFAAAKMAAEAGESENLFTVAMGGMAASARSFSEQLQKDLGLNAYEVRANTATIYQMASSMQLGQKRSYDLATGITKLAYDMASFYNLPTDEAFEKLRSGITGEAEPLKRLGILVDETTTKHVALAKGIAEPGKELTQQQKVWARYLSILDQTKNAQGDLARTLDSPVNQFRLLREEAKQIAIEFGTGILPAVKASLPAIRSVADGASSVAQAFAGLDEGTQKLILGLGVAVIATGPMVRGLGAVYGTAASTVGMVRKLTANSTKLGMVLANLAGNQMIQVSSASRKVTAEMASAAKQATALKGALAVGVGLATYELTKAVLEASGAYGAMREALGLAAEKDKEFVDQLASDKLAFSDTFAAYEKLRNHLHLTGSEWQITNEQTKANAARLAELLPRVQDLNRELNREAAAQRVANVVTADNETIRKRIAAALRQQDAALADVTARTVALYGVVTKKEAEQQMAKLVADFKLLASEGVSADQLAASFGPKIDEIAKAAKGYTDINMPQDFQNLKFALEGNQVYFAGLVDYMGRQVPEGAQKAGVALKGSIADSLREAASQGKEEAKKLLDDLQNMFGQQFSISVKVNLDTADAQRDLDALRRGELPNMNGAP